MAADELDRRETAIVLAALAQALKQGVAAIIRADDEREFLHREQVANRIIDQLELAGIVTVRRDHDFVLTLLAPR